MDTCKYSHKKQYSRSKRKSILFTMTRKMPKSQYGMVVLEEKKPSPKELQTNLILIKGILPPGQREIVGSIISGNAQPKHP